MRFAAFDLEIAKVLPQSATDLKRYRPLGISCAALAYDDRQDVRSWQGVPQLGCEECSEIVEELQDAVDQGYTIVTWNGCAFDFNILADESGLVEECAELALSHVDLMMLVTFTVGHFLALDKALAGAGLSGKVKRVRLSDGRVLTDMNGAMAPVLWNCGEYDAVVEYLKADVTQLLKLAKVVVWTKQVNWTSNSGRPHSIPVSCFRTARECFGIPEPDVSWMENPPRRTQFVDWMPDWQSRIAPSFNTRSPTVPTTVNRLAIHREPPSPVPAASIPLADHVEDRHHLQSSGLQANSGDDWDALYRLGDRLLTAGRYASALRCTQRLVELRPNDFRSAYAHGTSYNMLTRADWTEAQWQALTRFLRSFADPQDAAIGRYAAQAQLLESGLTTDDAAREAVTWFELALALAPNVALKRQVRADLDTLLRTYPQSASAAHRPTPNAGALEAEAAWTSFSLHLRATFDEGTAAAEAGDQYHIGLARAHVSLARTHLRTLKGLWPDKMGGLHKLSDVLDMLDEQNYTIDTLIRLVDPKSDLGSPHQQRRVGSTVNELKRRAEDCDATMEKAFAMLGRCIDWNPLTEEEMEVTHNAAIQFRSQASGATTNLGHDARRSDNGMWKTILIAILAISGALVVAGFLFALIPPATNPSLERRTEPVDGFIIDVPRNLDRTRDTTPDGRTQVRFSNRGGEGPYDIAITRGDDIGPLITESAADAYARSIDDWLAQQTGLTVILPPRSETTISSQRVIHYVYAFSPTEGGSQQVHGYLIPAQGRSYFLEVLGDAAHSGELRNILNQAVSSFRPL